MLKDTMFEAVQRAAYKGYTDVQTFVLRSELPSAGGMLDLVTAIGDELDLHITWETLDSGFGDTVTVILDWLEDDLDALSDAMAALYAYASEITSKPLYAD